VLLAGFTALDLTAIALRRATSNIRIVARKPG